MAFCTNCGRKLNPGEICICQQQNGTANGQTARQQVPNGQIPNQQGMGQQVPNGQVHQQGMGQQVPNGQVHQQGMGQQMPNGQVHQQGMGQQVPNGQVYQQGMGRQMPNGQIHQQGMGQQVPNGQIPNQQRMGQQIPYNQGMPNQQMYYQQPKRKLNFDIQGMAKNYLQILLKPKSAGRAFVKEANIITAFIFIALQAICSGLFAVVFFGKINGLVKAKVLSWDSDYLTMFDLYKFPLLKDFFITVVASVVLTCIIALVVWGMTSAFKGKTNFMETISAAAVRCVAKTPVILVALLLGLINVGFGMIFFMLSAVVGLCYSCMVVPTGVGADGDKTVFIVLVACLASLLCMFIFFRYMSVTYFSAALQTSVSKAISELQDVKDNLSKILTQFF